MPLSNTLLNLTFKHLETLNQQFASGDVPPCPCWQALKAGQEPRAVIIHVAARD